MEPRGQIWPAVLHSTPLHSTTLPSASRPCGNRRMCLPLAPRFTKATFRTYFFKTDTRNGHEGHLFETSVGEDLTEDGEGLTAGTRYWETAWVSGRLESDVSALHFTLPLLCTVPFLNSKTVSSWGRSSLGRHQLSQALTQIRELYINPATKGS